MKVQLLVLLLAAFVAAGQSNSPAPTAVVSSVAVTNDPVEIEFRKIMADDDEAMDKAQALVRQTGDPKDASNPAFTPMRIRLRQIVDPVSKEYKNFIEHHPDHVYARLAYGSFLNDSGDEAGALVQWEKARDLAPTNPAPWNNLGMAYSQRGLTNAFECFEKALSLKPNESIYNRNLAGQLLGFRAQATNFYHLSDEAIVEKSQGLYRQAVKLDPENLVLITEYAQSFYQVKPPHWPEALQAWESALKLARTEVEREGVLVHVARVKIQMGQLDEARRQIDTITNENLASLRRSLNEEMVAAFTNRVTANATSTNAAPVPK